MKNTVTFFFVFLPFLLPGQIIDTLQFINKIDSIIKNSRILIDKQQFEEALKEIKLSKKIAEDILGKEHALYAICTFNLGRTFHYKKDYSEAEIYYQEAIKIQEKVLGKYHIDYTWSLNNLANLYRDMYHFDKAEPLYLESMTIRKELLGEYHPNYIISMYLLAINFLNQSNNQEAEKLLLKVIDLSEKVHGKEHLEYSRNINTLANLYRTIGQYEKAELLYLEACRIRKKNLGNEHSSVATTLSNLAVTYTELGRYEKAEALFIEAKKIREKTLGKEHPVYAESLNNLAGLCVYMGQYKKAESLYLESKSIREKTLGKESSDYALSLYNLAIVYDALKLPVKSEEHMAEAVRIREKLLGKDHSEYAASIEGLAIIYSHLNKYVAAESLYVQAKDIREKTLGKKNPYYALSLFNLASHFTDIGQYTKALSLLQETQLIQETTHGKEHKDYINSLNILVNIHQKLNHTEEAKLLLIEIEELIKKLIIKSTYHLSEHELGEYITSFSENQSSIFSFHNRVEKKYADLDVICYNNMLFYKGFLHQFSNRVEHLLLADSSSIEKNNLLKSFHRRLSAQYALPIAERDSAQITDLEEKANTLEKELVRTVAGFAETRKQVTWQEVQTQLQSNEAAIEFVHYQYYTPEATDSVLYSALVLRPGWESPRMVYLCEQRQLDSLLQGADAGATVGQLYAYRGITPGNKTGSDQLYQLLWQPLDSLLGGVNTVYFSPSGLLHRVAFHAIPTPNKNEVLADRYKLFQLFSTRSLAVKTTDTTLPTSATLFGGIVYDAEAPRPSTDSLDAWAAMPFSSSLLPNTRSRRGEGWQYLPGTAQEVDRLQRLFLKQHIQSTTWTDTLASEERFKTLGTTGASPAILHLATHGFFFPDPKLDKKTLGGFAGSSIPLSENPLMRSGLLLAGANQAWKEGKPLPGKEDGILTAYEIAQVNLSGTQLAVLSACETGLGDIQPSEGVMGLQRAFKMAGVDKLIVSLWQVPDKQTAVFMESFYTNWLTKGSNIRDAFYDTQSQMRKRYKDPLVWAGFVLVE